MPTPPNRGADSVQTIPQLLVLLDDMDPQVCSAAKAKLEAIGEPGPAAEECLSAALRDGKPHARRYALGVLAARPKLTAEQVSLVALTLTSEAEEDRLLAVRLLANAPTESKRQTVPTLLSAMADPSQVVGAAAEKALADLQPLLKDAREPLTDGLKSDNSRVRLFCLKTLSGTVEKTQDVVPLFAPHLSDADPQVRVAALDCIGKRGESASRLIRPLDVLANIDSKDPDVQLAAVQASGQLGLSAAAPRLLRLLAPSTPATLKASAFDVLLTLDINSTSWADDVFAAVLGDPKLPTPDRWLDKLLTSGRPLKPFLPKVVEHLAGDDEKARVSALKVVVKAGAGAEHGSLFADAVGRSDAEAEVALRALATLGADGTRLLVASLDKKLPTDRRVQVCQTLAPLAQHVKAEHVTALLAEAQNRPESREAVGQLFAKVDPALVYPHVRVIARSEAIGRPPVQQRRSVYEVPFQVWALETAGLLDLRKVPQAEREKFLAWLANVVKFDLDASCRQAAVRTLATLEANAKAGGK